MIYSHVTVQYLTLAGLELFTTELDDKQVSKGYLDIMQYFTVGIATGYGLDGPGSIPGRARFSLLHSVQTGSGAQPASYPMDTRGPFPGGKAHGA
jgi:hypothetical protein